MSRSRNWCFTLNNYSETDIANCDVIECDYIIYGKEIGAEGTPHLQGYIEFSEAKTMSSIKKKLGKSIHLETRKGSADQAMVYCKKENNFTERGAMSRQGKRTDLDEIAELVITGGLSAVVKERPDAMIKYGRNIERLCELKMTMRTEKPEVIWLYGKSGVGKTRTAAERDADYYIWNGTKWWNGYRQQKVVIIDDFECASDDEAKFRYLLRLLDRYAIQVETKGGMVPFNSPIIYVTCEFAPVELFPLGNTLKQITRRIDKIEELFEETTTFENELVNPANLTELCSLEPEDNIIDDELDDQLGEL